MNNEFYARVFRWLGIGLFITFLVGYFVSTNLNMLSFIFSGYTYIILFILEIVICIFLTARIHKMDPNVACGLYIGYTALTGLTFSSIFIVYEVSSIIYVFLATSLVFLVFSIIGKRMNVDLRKMGIYLFVLLIAVIVLEIINIFIMNQTLDMVSCILGLCIFVGYIAYDVRKIEYYDDSDNMAIIGAFNLYLDFINIFIRLLQLFGKRRD